MVVGSGMIAKCFYDYKDDDRFIIFASGVSNSSLNDIDAFDREKQLLIQTRNTCTDKLFVYFSTCSIYDNSLAYSPYVQHKLQMESLVAKHLGGYTIFRVSNPIGITANPNTMLNYFINAIQHRQSFTIYSGSERNLIDLDDMYKLCDYILQNALFIRSIVNIANPGNYSILYIIKNIETYFFKNAIFSIVNKSSIPRIDTSAIQSLYQVLKINFGDGYLTRLLKKYYPLS